MQTNGTVRCPKDVPKEDFDKDKQHKRKKKGKKSPQDDGYQEGPQYLGPQRMGLLKKTAKQLK
jgi:hypothetical protein